MGREQDFEALIHIRRSKHISIGKERLMYIIAGSDMITTEQSRHQALLSTLM